MLRCAIFIDVGYLDKVLEREFHGVKVDYSRLIETLAAGRELLRTYVYHCLPYQSNPPTLEERQRFGATQGFFNKLERIPRVQVRLGRLESRGHDSERRPIFIQKRVDVLKATDLVALSIKNKITHAILIAGDSDFIPAIEVAKSEGVVCHLWHGKWDGNKKCTHTDLVNVCDEHTQFTSEIINQMLR